MYGDEIEKLSEFLEHKGWVQHVYKAKGFKHPGIRVVIKKGQRKRLLTEFVEDVRVFKDSQKKAHRRVHHHETPVVSVSAKLH